MNIIFMKITYEISLYRPKWALLGVETSLLH